jgi:hypothetical protein
MTIIGNIDFIFMDESWGEGWPKAGVRSYSSAVSYINIFFEFPLKNNSPHYEHV